MSFLTTRVSTSAVNSKSTAIKTPPKKLGRKIKSVSLFFFLLGKTSALRTLQTALGRQRKGKDKTITTNTAQRL